MADVVTPPSRFPPKRNRGCSERYNPARKRFQSPVQYKMHYRWLQATNTLFTPCPGVRLQTYNNRRIFSSALWLAVSKTQDAASALLSKRPQGLNIYWYKTNSARNALKRAKHTVVRSASYESRRPHYHAGTTQGLVRT